MRVLITGSRNWTDSVAIRVALLRAIHGVSSHKITLVHGGARGADTLAGEIAEEFEIDVEVHPADWDRYKKRAGIIRNEHMVRLGAFVCLAFPLGESRGTRHCIAACKRAGIPVIVHEGVT